MAAKEKDGLHYTVAGEGQLVVLVHGLAASGRYWTRLADLLVRKFRILIPDLLGFGLSPKPRSAGYSLTEQVKALWQVIDSEESKKPVVFVGHSAGAIVAVAAAAARPGRVKAVVLLGPPIFAGKREFRQRLGLRSRLLMYGPLAWMVCHTVCRVGPISRRLAVHWLDLPREIAEDSVLHTWRSYSRTLAQVVERQAVRNLLTDLKRPILIIYGDRDRFAVAEEYKGLQLTNQWVEVNMMAGDHHLAVKKPKEVEQAIMVVLD